MCEVQAPSSIPQTWFQLACLSKPLHSITPLLTPFRPPPPPPTHSLTLFPCLPHSPPSPPPSLPMQTLASSPGYETQGKKSAQDLSYRKHTSLNLQSSIQFCICKGAAPCLVTKFVLRPRFVTQVYHVLQKDSTWTACMDIFFFLEGGGAAKGVPLWRDSEARREGEGKKGRGGGIWKRGIHTQACFCMLSQGTT